VAGRAGIEMFSFQELDPFAPTGDRLILINSVLSSLVFWCGVLEVYLTTYKYGKQITYRYNSLAFLRASVRR